MLQKKSALALLAFLALSATVPARAADAIGVEAAKVLPIADIHFHVMPWMVTTELVRRMDAHHIRWAGGAAPFPEKTGAGSAEATAARNAAIGAALGERYIRATGQGQWINLKMTGGVEALHNADSGGFKSRLALMQKDLEAGAKVIGEIHVNTAGSAPNELLRHTVKADAPTLRALLDLASAHAAPLNIHAELSGTTAEEVGRLAEHNRLARLILAHCGSRASAKDIRAVMENHPNVFCDLSFRSPPLTSTHQRNADRTIFSKTGGLHADWKKLIADFPDRFMVGIDELGPLQSSWDSYVDVVENIRFGLLANLPGDVAERVAYKNAQALFRLQ